MLKFIEKIFSIKKTSHHISLTLLGLQINIRYKSIYNKSYIQFIENIRLHQQNMLLANFAIHKPDTKKIKVYLLNDTRLANNHLGCHTVIENIFALCEKNNMEIIFTDADFIYYHENEEYFKNIMSKCDIVLVNGEGTLHHDCGYYIFKKCELAKRLNKKVVLINSVWVENVANNNYLPLFDLISLRESISYKNVIEYNNKNTRVVPDLTLYGTLEKNKEVHKEIIFVDSVILKTTNKLIKLAKKFRSSFYFMHSPKKNYQLLDVERLKSLSEDSLIVSGRFHALTLALKLGIPTLSFPSNTPKIEGLLHDANLLDYLVDDRKDITTQIDNFLNNEHTTFKKRSKVYLEQAQLEIEKLFIDIASLVQEYK